jgi:thiamine kinase-like enzyme
MLERYERIIDRLIALPTTFIHGELYASNILVQEADPVRVCPVDWEMAAIGPGLIDLAALTAGQWSEEERRDLSLAYSSAQVPGTGAQPVQETLFDDLNCCRLHLAVQWLGWSADWTPPPSQTQDWLGEAMWVAERVSA